MTNGQGELVRGGERPRLRFERRLAHPPERVWRALTEDADLAAWFPTTIEGDREAGATLHFNFRGGEAEGFEGRLLTWEPTILLEFEWGPDDHLRFELRPDGDGTLLIFTDDFTPVGKAARDGAGWHSCFDGLAAHLDGTTPPERRWEEVHPAYVERFGAEASTLGPPEGMA